ncbi:MAG: alpha-ketoacid dehydrogenase subunit beta [Chloroflexota bacterium]
MREITYGDAIHEALHEEMLRDPTVYIIGEDAGLNARPPKASAGFYQEFGADRVIDAPIAEAAIIGGSVGAAMAGMRPVVDIMNEDFMLETLDVLVNHAARETYCSDGVLKVPMVIRATFGAGGEQVLNLESWFMHIPGLKVVMPTTPYDAKGLLKSAIRDNNVVLFLEHGSFGRGLKGQVPEKEYTIPIGVADIKRKGKDVTVVAVGKMVHEALAAAETLAKESISLEVIDLRSLSPLDKKTFLDSVKKTGRLIIAHQAWKTCGLGAEISAIVCEEALSSLKAPIIRVTAIEIPPPFHPALQAMAYPSKDDIINAAKKVMSR